MQLQFSFFFLVMQLQFQNLQNYSLMQLQFFSGINSAKVFCGRVTVCTNDHDTQRNRDRDKDRNYDTDKDVIKDKDRERQDIEINN